MTIDVVNKEIGVCQSCEDLSVWLLLHNINVMPTLKLIHITPKYKVAYGVNISQSSNIHKLVSLPNSMVGISNGWNFKQLKFFQLIKNYSPMVEFSIN